MPKERGKFGHNILAVLNRIMGQSEVGVGEAYKQNYIKYIKKDIKNML